jgi:hypothetical protein
MGSIWFRGFGRLSLDKAPKRDSLPVDSAQFVAEPGQYDEIVHLVLKRMRPLFAFGLLTGFRVSESENHSRVDTECILPMAGYPRGEIVGLN